jgi:hypothetical protein
MKMYGVWMYRSPLFFTSALVGGEWSPSRPGRFTLAEQSPRYLMDGRKGGPQKRSGQLREKKYLAFTGTQTPTPRSSSLYPVAIPTTPSQLPHYS